MTETVLNKMTLQPGDDSKQATVPSPNSGGMETLKREAPTAPVSGHSKSLEREG